MALGTPVAAATAYSTAGGTSVSPAYPAGILATDVVLLFIGQKPLTANVNGGTVTTPSGWTLRDELLAAGGYGTTIGADTGNTNLRVYSWNTPVAGQTGNLAVTLGQNEMSWAFMVRIPTGGGAPEYGSADGQRTTAPTVNVAFTVNLTNGATATNFQSGDRAIWAMCIPTDVTTPSQFSAQSITATGATFGTATELNEPDSQLGNDIGGYSAWAAVTAGSSTAAPSVTVTAGGTVTNVRGPIVLLRVREGAAPQTLTPNLYTNDQTFYGPTVTTSYSLTPALYTNDQTFYDPTVAQIQPAQNLTPSLYTNDQTFYGPTVSASNTLAPNLYTNDQTFYGPTVSTSVTLTPDLYTNTQTFYNATVSASNALTPALYTNDQTFYSATVGTSSTLFPDLYTNTQTFFAPTVAAGAVTLTPSLYTNDQTFYDATVSQGGVVLQPSLYTNDQTFYAPTVSAGAVNVSPSLYTNDQTFYNATVSAFSQVTPDLYVNQQTFFAADVTTSYGLLPDLYVNTQAFYAPTVASGAITLQPSLYTNTQDFYAAAVTTTYDLSPQLFTNTQDFYSPTVSEQLVVAPDLYTNTQTFYDATVTPGAVELLPQGYADPGYVDNGYVGPNTYSEQIFYSPTVIWDQFVDPSLFTNTQTFFSPTVYFLYPIPSDVRAGVRYGPGGIYVGTLTVGAGESIIRLRSFTERC